MTLFKMLFIVFCKPSAAPSLQFPARHILNSAPLSQPLLCHPSRTRANPPGTSKFGTGHHGACGSGNPRRGLWSAIPELEEQDANCQQRHRGGEPTVASFGWENRLNCARSRLAESGSNPQV